MQDFKNKSIFITGGSRGIGKAIGLRLAAAGANITIAAKTAEPHPVLPGTIYSAADEMEAAGGKALAVVMDVRSEEMVEAAVAQAVDKFGGIDILINNASAINLSGTESLKMKHYDLMQDVNARGTFLTSKTCLPFLKKSSNPHILNLSPPLNMDKKWFSQHPAYTLSKYGMSMFALGMAEEFKPFGIGVNALWPQTLIATAAVKNVLGQNLIKKARTPEIVADAAFFILKRDSKNCTGNFFVDEKVLIEEGIEDFSKYTPFGADNLMTDLFL